MLIFFASALRYTTVTLSLLGLNLPDAAGDMVYFYNVSLNLSRAPLWEFLSSFPGLSSETMSWFGSILIMLFGENIFALQLLSAAIGIASIVATYNLGCIVFNNNEAKKAAWMIAIFPTHVLYSSLFLRDIYSCFFITIGGASLIKYHVSDRSVFAFISIFYFFAGAAFHGAVISCVVVVLLILSYKTFKRLHYGKILISHGTIVVASIIFVSWFLLIQDIVTVSKLSNFINSDSRWDIILAYSRENYDSNGAYPNWLIPGNAYEAFKLLPARILYFLIGPFPWDVRSVSHLLGVLVGGLYLLLIGFSARTLLRFYKSNRTVVVLVLLVIFIVGIFGYFVSNFGTSIRHKLKVLPFLIILSAPFIPSIKLKDENLSEKPRVNGEEA